MELKQEVLKRMRVTRRVSLVLQTEASECGLACLVMVCNYHGNRLDLRALRVRFALSLKGATLAHIMQIADALAFAARPVRLEVDELKALQLPCILHWDLNHFVVLTEVRRDGVTVHDPAKGLRRYGFAEVSQHFTGVALEGNPP